jgi:hypothetical protein
MEVKLTMVNKLSGNVTWTAHVFKPNKIICECVVHSPIEFENETLAVKNFKEVFASFGIEV